MGRAATATINLSAIKHNYQIAKARSPHGKAMAIIKANAYGHGACVVAHALEADVDAFGVACIEEAIELRGAGITKPILLLEGFFTLDELDYISENNLWCALHDLAQITALSQLSLKKPINVWLKMDSGMHRLGINPQDYVEAYKRLKDIPFINEIVLMSHFSSADDVDDPKTMAQISCFNDVTAGLDAPVSIANSAGLLAHSLARRDWQRPGIMLYGASPFADDLSCAKDLKPVMSLTSEVIAVRSLEAGDSVGYSEKWTCDKPTIVGTVAMGYADGYPRHAKNGTPVMVNGVRTKIIGRVSMDMLTVDLTDVPNAKVGASVELWGDHISANEVAACADTIPYTLFTGITNRVHKKYI
jgi:alanine racemase